MARCERLLHPPACSVPESRTRPDPPRVFPLRVTFRPPSQRQTASWTLSQPRPVEPSGLGAVYEAAEPRSNTRLSAGGKRIQKTDPPLRSRFQQRRKLLSRGLRLHEMVFETGCRWVEKPVT